jgi:transposase
LKSPARLLTHRWRKRASRRAPSRPYGIEQACHLWLLPHLAALRIRHVRAEGRAVWLEADVAAADAGCPACATISARVHTRYQRVLADPAIGGRPSLLRVRVRRFFCDNTGCNRRTFVEQVPDLTTPYARRTHCCAASWRRSAWRWVAGRALG